MTQKKKLILIDESKHGLVSRYKPNTSSLLYKLTERQRDTNWWDCVDDFVRVNSCRHWVKHVVSGLLYMSE